MWRLQAFSRHDDLASIPPIFCTSPLSLHGGTAPQLLSATSFRIVVQSIFLNQNLIIPQIASIGFKSGEFPGYFIT